jgi:hypothetical protein
MRRDEGEWERAATWASAREMLVRVGGGKRIGREEDVVGDGSGGWAGGDGGGANAQWWLYCSVVGMDTSVPFGRVRTMLTSYPVTAITLRLARGCATSK